MLPPDHPSARLRRVGSLDPAVALWLGVVFILVFILFYMYVFWDYKVQLFKPTGFAAAAAERRARELAAVKAKAAADALATPKGAAKKELLKTVTETLKGGFVRQSTFERLQLERDAESLAGDKKVNVSAGSVLAMIARRERRQMTERQRNTFFFVLVPLSIVLLVTVILSGASDGVASVIVLLDVCVSCVAFVAFFTQTEFIESTGAELKAIKFLRRHPPKAFSIDPGTLRFWKQRGPAAWHFDASKLSAGVCTLGFEGVSSEPVTDVQELLNIASSSYGLVTFQQLSRREQGKNDGFETTVLTNFPLPAPQSDRYFEITVLDAAFDTVDSARVRAAKIQIGLACAPYPNYQLPGAHPTSLAWCVDD